MEDKDWQLEVSETIGSIKADTRNMLFRIEEVHEDLRSHLADPHAHQEVSDKRWKNVLSITAILISVASFLNACGKH